MYCMAAGEAATLAGGSAADSIKLHADAGANQTIVLLNDEGVIDSINYQGLSSVMCTAIQELSAKNDALEAKVTALENA